MASRADQNLRGRKCSCLVVNLGVLASVGTLVCSNKTCYCKLCVRVARLNGGSEDARGVCENGHEALGVHSDDLLALRRSRLSPRVLERDMDDDGQESSLYVCLQAVAEGPKTCWWLLSRCNATGLRCRRTRLFSNHVLVRVLPSTSTAHVATGLCLATG